MYRLLYALKGVLGIGVLYTYTIHNLKRSKNSAAREYALSPATQSPQAPGSILIAVKKARHAPSLGACVLYGCRMYKQILDSGLLD